MKFKYIIRMLATVSIILGLLATKPLVKSAMAKTTTDTEQVKP